MIDVAALEPKVLARLDAGHEAALERLMTLLKIPSISTDPAYREDCRRAAQLVVDELAELGFEARLVPTAGHPAVLAHHLKAGAGAPHVLFYGHYDVQPVDPIEQWLSDPFDPQIVKRPAGSACIRARGASDDKGQVRTFLEACRAWIEAAGAPPCRVTIFLEGEEESGSPSMEAFLASHVEELKADVALVCDTEMWNRTTPAVTLSLRGLAAGEVRVRAADVDLHSGLYGGAAQNPIMVLARILAGLKDETGAVTLPGFYDKVGEPPAALKALWDRLGFEPAGFLGPVGLSAPAGERGRSVLEQIWSRPTVEVNGIAGGYAGEGFKTVIPAEARAKVSFRLVGDQDPNAVWESFEAYVRARLPSDCEATFTRQSGSPGHIVPSDNPYLASVVAALNEEWGTETALIGCGGTIPIPGDLMRHLGVHTILPGFALEDDAIHSPNEKYELVSFWKGARSWARILARLALDADRAR